MRQIRLFSQFLFISVAVCLIVNPPMQGIFYPDNGRLSILMVAVSGFAFFSFYIEEFLEKERYICSFFKRFFSLSLLTLFSFGFSLLLFEGEKIFASPISPEIFNIWAISISELQPGYTGNLFKSGGILFLYTFVICLIALFPASLRMRKLLLSIGLPLFLFAIMTLISQRFDRPAAVFETFALLLSLHVFYLKFRNILEKYFTVTILFSLILIALYITFIALSYQNQKKSQAGGINPLEYLPYISEKPGCILGLNDRGPETAWGTGIAVIGSPYHSNVQGIIDNYNILNSQDSAQVQKLLKKRRVSTIILDNPEYYFLNHYIIKNPLRKLNVQVNRRTLTGQILSGENLPCFLKEAPKGPEKIRKRFLIYHVDFQKCEKTKTDRDTVSQDAFSQKILTENGEKLGDL